MVFHPPKVKAGSATWFSIILLTGVMLLIFGLGVYVVWGATTLSYEIKPDVVTITFGWKKTEIERSSITEVTILAETSRGRRMMGTSAPGLYEGRWSFAETGPITLFSTSTQPLTVIETSDRKWGISPADPQEFRRTLITGDVGHFVPKPHPNTASHIALLGVLFILGVPVPLGLVIFIIRLARRLRYELSDTALIIHGAWKSKSIPYEKITSIQVANPQGRPWRRFGMSAPGLYWGSFKWKVAGANLTLYATRLRPLVLLSVGHHTYGVTPQDEARFASELEKRIQR